MLLKWLLGNFIFSFIKMVVYKPTPHRTWLRRSRLGTATKNYNNAYKDYKDWVDGYNQVRHNRRRFTATNMGANNDWVVKQVWLEVRKSKNNLNSAKRTLKAETKRANSYYKKSKSK